MEIGQLVEWNPWWENNEELLKALAGKPRLQYQEVIRSLKIREVTIITGIRRSGKSTLMYQMAQKLLQEGIKASRIFLINLEDKKLEKKSLDEIYQTYREQMNLDEQAYIFFDEIHRKKGWESWIRKKYDLKTKDKFVLSSSSSYLLRKEYATLLTGRNLTFEVYPLSFEEFLAFKEIALQKERLKKGVISEATKMRLMKNFKEYLFLGGFPEILLKQKHFQMKILEQYFDDILYKDIVDRYTLNSQKTKDLALYFMTNVTGIISLRALRNSLQLSYDTIKDYLAHFKEAFLFFTADHFSDSFKEQKTLPSKLYCIDNGLRNAVSFAFSRDEGKLAENMVFIELRRRQENPYYWKNKGEVDFVIKNRGQSLTAINVSYTDELEKRETEALLEFKKAFPKTKKLLLLTKDTERKEQGILMLPLWKWLLER